MIFVTLFAVACSWFAVKLQQARRQREAVEAIKRIGGLVSYDYEMDPYPDVFAERPRRGPLWLRKLLGDDFFNDIVYVTFFQATVTEADLEHLKELPRLQQLLLDNPQVTDAYVERLKGLTSLRLLDLDDTRITDAGLEHLKGLTHLYRLSLDDTQITDACLEHIKGLTQLKCVDLNNTHVTSKGVRKLQNALPSCQIWWNIRYPFGKDSGLEATESTEAENEDRRVMLLHYVLVYVPRGVVEDYAENRLLAKYYFDDANTAELAEAAKNGDIERINALVAAGASPNAKGLGGFTPLIYSMSGKTTKGFQRLLKLGGDPNLQTDVGLTDLDYSVSAMCIAAGWLGGERLKLVLAHGGNPNLVSRKTESTAGSTPISDAIFINDAENARLLIKAGADVNARNASDGKTPLMDAATFSFDVMYVLLEAGADIRAKDDAGLPVSYYVLYHDRDYNPLLDACQSQKKCREFMEKKGVDFKKEKIQNEEILRQIQKRNEADIEKGRQSQEGKIQINGRKGGRECLPVSEQLGEFRLRIIKARVFSSISPHPNPLPAGEGTFGICP